jgi:REP element-mobilizing transposase RayT
MAENISKSHNVSVLLYHLVCPAKYRRKIFSEEVTKSLLLICFEITEKHEIEFLEIGTDADHVHFLIQGIPRMSPSEIVRVVKSITGREIFRLHPEVKIMLWGGHIWSSGYYINTVGQHGTEEVIKRYIESQGRVNEYEKVYSNQLKLF